MTHYQSGAGDVRDVVKLPAILMMVVGAVYVGMGLVLLIGNALIAAGAGLPVFESGSYSEAQLTYGLIGGAFMVVLGGPVFWGGLELRKLRRYGLALIGAICAMLPLSCFFILGLGIGIWVLIVLMRPEVKRAFDAGGANGAAGHGRTGSGYGSGGVGYGGGVGYRGGTAGTGTLRSGMAITAFVLSLGSFLLLCFGPLVSIAAVILGFVSHAAAKREPRVYGGGGLSLASIFIGFANLLVSGGMIVLVMFFPMMLPVLGRARSLANRSYDAGNEHSLLIAIQSYEKDNGGALPPHLAAAAAYIDRPKILVSKQSGTAPLPEFPPGVPWATFASDVDDHCDYEYTGAGLKESDIRDPSRVILLMEKDLYRGEGRNIGFADGHVEWVKAADLSRVTDEDARLRALMHPVAGAAGGGDGRGVPAERRTPARRGSMREMPAGAEKTELLGGNGGGNYLEVDPAGRPMIGVYYVLADWGNRKIVRELRPVYEKHSFPDASTVMGKPGYAVGGMVFSTDDGTNGFQVIFMRMNNGKIDVRDKYVSDWYGNQRAGSKVTQLAGKGETVLGLFGRKGMNQDGIGLIVKTAAGAGK